MMMVLTVVMVVMKREGGWIVDAREVKDITRKPTESTNLGS